MALYIKPPKGSIGFNKLCEFVKKRLTFLHFLRGKSTEEITDGIQQETLAYSSDCLIEGSAKDRASHFVLRLLCSAHHDMETFLIQSEAELFMYRLEFYELSDVRQMLWNAVKQSIDVCKHQYIIKSYKHILTTLIHIAKNFDFAVNKNQHLKVPFTAALDFVKERLYPLHSGYIEVPLQGIKCLLVSVFREILTQGINQIKSSCCFKELKDPRMCYMQQGVKQWFNSNIAVTPPILSNNVILEENLNNESLNFPLCMANVHNLLRKNHRLQHNSRVQYILFLKEIGVPYHEVITLFMKEYSISIDKQKLNASNCSHSWDDSKNRYIYSIEHLYGKRGSRKNYKAHTCHSLQSFGNSSSTDGGCPFTHFDGDNMINILKPCSSEVVDIEDIKSLSLEKSYTKACHLYLMKKVQSSYCSTSKIPIHTLRNKEPNSIQDTMTCNDILKFPDNIKNIASAFIPGIHFYKKGFANKFNGVLRPSEFYFILQNLKQTVS